MVQKRSKAGLNTGCSLRLLRYRKHMPRFAAEQFVLGKHKNFSGTADEELMIDDGDLECLLVESLFYSMNKRRRWLIEEKVRSYMHQPPSSDIRVVMLTRVSPLELSLDLVIGNSNADCLSYRDDVLQTTIEAFSPVRYQDMIGNALKCLHEDEQLLVSPYEAQRRQSKKAVQRKIPPPVDGYRWALRDLKEERKEERAARENKFQSCRTVKYEIFSPQEISARHFSIKPDKLLPYQKKMKDNPTSMMLISEGLSSGITHNRKHTRRKGKLKEVRVKDFNQGKLEGGPSWKRGKTKYMRLGLYLQLLVNIELKKKNRPDERSGKTPSSRKKEQQMENDPRAASKKQDTSRTVAQQTGDESFFMTEIDIDEIDVSISAIVHNVVTSNRKPSYQTKDASCQVCSSDLEFEWNTPKIVEFPFEAHPKPKYFNKCAKDEIGKHPKPNLPKKWLLKKDMSTELAIIPKEPTVLSDQSLETLAEEVGDCMVLAMNLNVPTRILAIIATSKFQKEGTKLKMSVEFLQYWRSMRRTASSSDKVEQLLRELSRLGRLDVATVVRRCHQLDQQLDEDSFPIKDNRGFRRK